MQLNQAFPKSLMTTMFLVAAMAAAALADGPAKKAAAENNPVAGLTPCLAVAVDGSPIWPTTGFFAGNQELVVAFQLGNNEAFKQLTAIWSVGDVGGDSPTGVAADLPRAGRELARQTIDLNGQRSGRLAYCPGSTLKTGRYHLEALADGNPWKSADLTVVPDLAPIAVTPATFLPLIEGKRWDFDMVVQLAPALQAVSELVYGKDVRRDSDGTIHGRMSYLVGPVESAGTRIDMLLNDKLFGQMWWKLSVDGLSLTQEKIGNNIRIYDPARLMVAMPRALPITWSWKAKDGSEQHDFQMIGPLASPLGNASDQPTAYLVIDNYSTGKDEMATSVMGFVPGAGIPASMRVLTDQAGHVLERRVLSQAGSAAFLIQPNDKLKGRIGRLVVDFPAGLKADDSPVDVFTDAGLKQSAGGGYGAKTFSLLPGNYWVKLNSRVVPVEVQSRNDTIVLTGGLRVDPGEGTAVEIYSDKECKTLLLKFYGKKDVGLPIGTVFIKIGGKAEPVEIQAGKIAEF